MNVLEFRTCKNIIDIKKRPFVEKEYEKKEKTVGFYCRGYGKESILILYVETGEVRLLFESSEYNIRRGEIEIKCKQQNDNLWLLTAQRGEIDLLKFYYEPYFYYEEEDDGEEDVNFGLWIMSLLAEKNKMERFIKANC